MTHRTIPKTVGERQLRGDRFSRLLSIALAGGGAFSMAGCGGAPSITIAGAYFPAWLLCALFAVVVAAITRAVMVATGLANHIPYQLAVCLSVGVIAGVILWRLWVVHS